MKNNKFYSAAIVGAGYVSEFHIKALKRLPNVRIVGITDVDLARAKAAAQRFGITAFPSLEVLAAEGIDVVHVLTPPNSHVDVALEALSLGCHALIEKPLATSVEDCDRLIAASKATGLEVSVNHSLLGDPFVKRALALVRAGAIGDVLTADYMRSSSYPPYRGGPLPPQYREGGYQFRDLGVHGLYLIRELLGAIEGVHAEFRTSGVKDRDPNILFDEWRAQVRCKKGTGNIQLSWNVKPLQHQLIIQGTSGTLRADLFALHLTRRRHTPFPKAAERVINALGESFSSAIQLSWNAALFVAGRIQPYQGLHNFVSAFYEALSTNNAMPVSLEQAREVVRWTEQVARDADREKSGFYRHYKPSLQPAVVVTGANGLLGTAFLKRLVQKEKLVRVFVRRLPPPEILHDPRVEVVLGDLGDPEAVNQVVEGSTAVIHIGAAMGGGWAAHEAATITGTRNIVDASLTHHAPLIYVSSLSVIDWAGHPANQPVTESTALEPSPQQRGFYTQSKLAAERIVQNAAQEKGLPAIILRPGQIWTEISPLISAAVGIRVGKHFVVIGDDSNLLPMVHVDDVVEAIMLAMHSGFRHGEVFHIVDRDLISRKELIHLYTSARGPQLKVTHISLKPACLMAECVERIANILNRPAPVSPYRLRSAIAPLIFDCSKAREQLGWLPHAHTGEALRKLLTTTYPSTSVHAENGQDLIELRK